MKMYCKRVRSKREVCGHQERSIWASRENGVCVKRETCGHQERNMWASREKHEGLESEACGH